MALFGKKHAVGLELDTGEARAVEMKGPLSEPTLTSWGRITLPRGAVEEGMVMRPDEVAPALAELWGQNGIGSREVVLGVANQGVLVRFATFPKVPPEKLENIIRFQAQDHIPIPLNSVVLDYTILGETEGERGQMLEVLLVAARRDMLDNYFKTLAAAHLKPLDMDVTAMAMLRLLPSFARKRAVAMVDLAVGLTNILIAVNGLPRLARQLSVTLKEALTALNCEPENLPCTGGFSGETMPPELDSWSQSLAAEIRSSIGYYQGQPNAVEVDGIILSGRGARVAGLAAHLEKTLSLPVKPCHPLEGIRVNSGKDISRMAPDYAVSISLARRGLEG